MNQVVGGRRVKDSSPSSSARSSGIRWFGDFGNNPVRGLMGPVCAERCNCNFEFQGPAGLPQCTDAPDDQRQAGFAVCAAPQHAAAAISTRPLSICGASQVTLRKRETKTGTKYM